MHTRRNVLFLIVTVVVSVFIVQPVFASPANDLASLAQEQADLDAELDTIMQDIRKVEDDHKVCEAELAEAQAEVDSQYSSMKDRIRYMYEDGDVSMMNAMLGAKSMADFVNKAYFVSSISDYDRKMLNELEAARNVEVMWLLKKIVPDFRCIADFRKDNAKAIKEVFRSFVKLCNGAGLLSHESVVIDGSKFRAVNADNKSYISANVSKVLKDIDEKIDQYMNEMDVRDKEEAKPGELGKEDLSKVLDYLERRKVQLTEALKKIEESGGNQICTTDPECRVMKSRDGLRPSFNVQTAVESENHLIVHYDVTDECVDWNLLKAGIDASKEALDVENIEGIADRGYSNSDEILDCLLAGDTPTTHPNKGEKNRIFRFNKITDEITEEMKKSTDPEVLKKCIAAGVLPDVLHREDIELETFKRRETGTSVYMKTPGSSTSRPWWRKATRPIFPCCRDPRRNSGSGGSITASGISIPSIMPGMP